MLFKALYPFFQKLFLAGYISVSYRYHQAFIEVEPTVHSLLLKPEASPFTSPMMGTNKCPSLTFILIFLFPMKRETFSPGFKPGSPAQLSEPPTRTPGPRYHVSSYFISLVFLGMELLHSVVES